MIARRAGRPIGPATGVAALLVWLILAPGCADGRRDPAASGASAAPEGVRAVSDASLEEAAVEGLPVALWRGGAPLRRFSRTQEAIDAALPGDTIRVSPGVYFERLSFRRSGTPERPVTLEGLPGARPIFDGAFEPLARGRSPGWRPEPELGSGVFSVPFAPAQRTAVYLASGARLFSHVDRSGLRVRSGPGVFADVAGKRLYVRLAGGADPRAVPLFAASGGRSPLDDKVLEVAESAHVVIRGIELRHGGLATLRVSDSTDVTIEDVVVRGGAHGISVRGASSGVRVVRCRVLGSHDPDWYWRDQKSNVHMESNGIGLRADSGNLVEYTEVAGWFNGINAKNGRVETPDRNRGLVLRYNLIHDIVDDGIELDGYLPAARIYENRLEDVFSGVSMSPRFSPRAEDTLLFYRNRVAATKSVRFDRAGRGSGHPKVLKLGSGRDPLRGNRNFGPEGVRFYQNTFFGTHDVVRAGFGSRPVVFPRDFQWYNNIFYTQNGPTFRGSGAAADGVRLDGNLYYQERRGAMFAAWNGAGGRHRDLASVRASRAGREAGWEAHGIEAAPGFVDPSPPAPLLSLRASGAAHEGGVTLPSGLPDSVEPVGRPDCGALEYSETFAIERLIPDRGPRAGGGRVFVRGRYLDDETEITLGGRALEDATLISSNVMVATLPQASASGPVALVARRGTRRVEVDSAYTYE